MADSILPVALNQGLDLVTPPLMIEHGALIGCLNYEMTDTAGYKRVDGYERYDGYPTGAVYEFYRVQINAVNPVDQALIVPGVIISRIGDGLPKKDIGVVVGGPFTGNYYDIVPLMSTDAFVTEEDLLLLQSGGFLLLQSELGVLRLQGDSTTLGDSFIITSLMGVQVDVTIGGAPAPGKSLGLTPIEYIDALREYSAVLRSFVDEAPTPIAGLYWFEDRLYGAVNALGITIVTPVGGPYPPLGVRLRWNGTIYRLVDRRLLGTGGADTVRLYMYPIGSSGTIDDNLVQVNTAGTTSTTWRTSVSTTGDPDSENSYTAVMGYFNNPDVSSTRGFTYLTPAPQFQFDAGSYPAPAITPPLTLNTNRFYWITNPDGTVLKVKLTEVVLESGVFASNNAVGRAQVEIVEQIAGTRDWIIDNDQLHDEYPTAGSPVLVVNGAPSYPVLAGTLALEAANTRYVWDAFNFYGQTATMSMYGATGASRAFWATTTGYGNIKTQNDPALDMPKYLAFHSARLALAYAGGSVVLSVVGEPYNYNGLDGAVEIATGDDVTGLVDLPGETLAVFGRRAIRKITGTTDADITLGTLAANSPCFDYTACLVGADAVYTGVHGITTLQQSSAYGDFVGSRLSNSIANWLRPKLVGTGSSFEAGGVAMAYVVRSKSQYRLVLSTGEIVCVTFTADGPKCTFMNHGLTNEIRIPFAWTSEIDLNGHEQVFARWNVTTLKRQAYQLESGWGYDGRTFNHRFDSAHTFNNNGSMFMGVEKVRMYGQGYGVATLNVKSSGIETDFDQAYHDRIQDISMPADPVLLYNQMQPVTSIIDQSNWGLGIKLRIQNTTPENTGLTEPSHICQVLVLHLRTEGALDG